MAWDDDYFFVAARLEEPHVQATLTERDAVIWHDNDFEIFIDPDSDTHEYYELEINAFATVFDLFLVKPYRDGGPALHYWDIAGLKKAVSIEGTINDPSDIDTGWEIELAIPWKVLAECANRAAPPSEGDVWRINFSRVEWKTVIEGGRYVKATDPETGKPYAERNWTWSPQGIVNMHYPEMWGYVLFTNVVKHQGGGEFSPGPDDKALDALREVYYAEKTYFIRYGEYTADFGALGLKNRDIFDQRSKKYERSCRGIYRSADSGERDLFVPRVQQQAVSREVSLSRGEHTGASGILQAADLGIPSRQYSAPRVQHARPLLVQPGDRTRNRDNRFRADILREPHRRQYARTPDPPE
jgi:hypothetical protein